MKIVAGMVAFACKDKDIFHITWQLTRIADRVNIIYGRFRGFPMRYILMPPSLRRMMSQPFGSRVKVSKADLKHTQPRQRDLYLEGIQHGDILFVCDSDMFPEYGPEIDTPLKFRDYFKDKAWDSALIEVQDREGNHEQSWICIYNYRLGWLHGSGQLLTDEFGTQITAPAYKVLKIPPEVMHLKHLRNQSKEYRDAQKKFWEAIKDGNKTNEG